MKKIRAINSKTCYQIGDITPETAHFYLILGDFSKQDSFYEVLHVGRETYSGRGTFSMIRKRYVRKSYFDEARTKNNIAVVGKNVIITTLFDVDYI